MIAANAVFWFVLALIFAALEIESEGKWGWAEKAPTWYRTTGFFAKLYGMIMGGKPLTGYHLFMFFMSLMVFHIPFFMGIKWSPTAELTTLATYLAWCALWDYLWFVLNPYYGVRNFKKTKVWWHSKSYWVLNLFPIDYAVGWGLSIALAYGASRLSCESSIFTRHIWLLGLFLAFTFVTIITIAPLYKRWHKMMRKHDDRDQAGIFHA